MNKPMCTKQTKKDRGSASKRPGEAKWLQKVEIMGKEKGESGTGGTGGTNDEKPGRTAEVADRVGGEDESGK